MIGKKKFLGVALSALLMISVAGCSGSNAGETSTNGTTAAGTSGVEATGTAAASQTEAVIAEGDFDWEFTARDMEVGYEESTAVKITLNGSSAEVSGNGASYTDGVITITQEGTYIFTGTLDDGRILVNVPDTDKVQIVLNGAAIHCETHAAIFIQQADKVFITLAEGADNQLTSGAAYELSEDDSNVDGVIFSRADLTLNGSGSLTVEAAYKHAIVSKDDLVITGGTYNITAVGGGLYGKDCVKIAAGTFTIQTGSDGIKSNNEEEENRGFVYIAGGTFTITAGTDGVQAVTILRMDDGTMTIISGGGSVNASTTAGGNSWGQWGPGSTTDTTDSSDTESSSAKGLKAGTSLLFNGGTVVIDSSDDSLHSNGSLTIQGGTLTMSSGDDGMHADGDLIINDGVILMEKSYEGIEGNNITINGGDITLTASDDGLNVAGGDGSSMNGRMGQNSFSGDSSSHLLKITGGVLRVEASGDGLDSNGDMVIEGGTVFVTGPTDSANGALDYEGSATISGGVLVAVGSTGMAEGMGTGSTQCSILHNFSSQIQAGETVTLTDSSGTVLVSYTPTKVYQSVVVSCPEMTQGETYTLTAGSQSESLTLESVVTSNGSGGMGGGGMKGGGQRPEDGSFSGDKSMPEMPSGDSNNMPQMPGGNTQESSDSTVPSV